MLSELLSGSLMMDSQGNIVHSSQQSTERKMPTTAKEMFHLTEANKSEAIQQRIKRVQESIENHASSGYSVCKYDFEYGCTLTDKIKAHFEAQGFEVSEEKDKDGDPRLVFSWEKPKDAQPGA